MQNVSIGTTTDVLNKYREAAQKGGGSVLFPQTKKVNDYISNE